MTNLQVQQMVKNMMTTMTHNQLTQQCIQIGEITSWCPRQSKFQLAVMLVQHNHNIWIYGTNVKNLYTI